MTFRRSPFLKPENLTPVVLAKLGYIHPIDYDVKSDGQLVVIDKTGRKFKLPKKDYENLLENLPQPIKIAKPRGRRPKVV